MRKTPLVLGRVASIAVLTSSVLSLGEVPAAAATLPGVNYVVNTTDDTDDSACGTHCSLREAIKAANANAGTDSITFAIPASGVQTISTSGLPTATGAVVIDGTTQSGYAGTPLIEIATTGTTGLQINGAGSVVRGLSITKATTGFPTYGVTVIGAGSTVEDNHLNVNAAGTARTNFSIPLNVYAGDHLIQRNVVASAGTSIYLRGGAGYGTGNNQILDNLIGTDVTGTVPLSSSSGGRGVDIDPDGGHNVIHGNVISSHYTGLFIGGSSNNDVTGNLIGTDITGTVDLGNTAAGVAISDTGMGGTTHVPSGNRIGGSIAADRNIISGNGSASVIGTGITVGGDANVVLGNYIGTDASGMSSLPNGRGVQVQQGTDIVIGGTASGEGNVISGNHENGLQFSFEAGGSRAQGNLIGVAADGTTPMGNGATGVYIGGLFNGSGVTIGGTAAGAPNVIAHNGTNGAGYPGVLVDSSSRYVSILGNSIHDNDGLGIDLRGGFGVTPNDGGVADDADVGGNDLVNFPVLSSVTPGTSSTTVAGNLDTVPTTTFRVEFFSSSACDARGHGEGGTFLGAASVATDGNGEATFSAPVTTPVAGSAITATATDSAGKTSEFSACVLDPRTPVAEPGSVTIVKQTDPAGGTGFTFTGPAGATTAGDGILGQGGESIVFYRGNDGLFLLDVATMTETFLAGTEGGQSPEFSPDSSKIAFGRSQSLGIYDLATGTIELVTDSSDALHAREPSWSPDGNWIVFHASDRLWVVPSDGSEAPTQLTTVQSAFPVWSADGRIAWRNGSSPNVRVATFDETTRSLIGATGLGWLDSQQRAMHWSPDGTQLAAGAAYDSASDTYLYVLTDTGTAPWPATQLTSDDNEGDKNSYHTDPTWKPDSSEIIFAGRYAGGDFDLYRVAPDGSAEAELFYGSSGTSESGPDWGQAGTTAEYTIDDGSSVGGLVPAGESVTFAELAHEGYDLESIVCDSPSAVVDPASASVTVTPEPGEDVTCTFTNVAAADAPVASAGGPYVVDEGSSVQLSASGTDVEGDAITYTWDFDNDGQYDDATGASPMFSAAGMSGPASKPISVMACDPSGDCDDADSSVTINNVAPSVEFSGSASVVEAGTYSGSGTVTDPGPDTITGTVNYGDGTTTEALMIDAEGQFTLSHVYADDNPTGTSSDPYTVTVTVSDGDGGTDTASHGTTVTNEAPVAGTISHETTPVPLGNSTLITMPFTDVGTEDTHTAVISWDDGTTSAGTVVDHEVSGSHVYAEAGVYTVSVTVTDDDTGSDSSTTTGFIVVFDPSGGSVTGGGFITSPAGAYLADPTMSGKANFGFVSQYKKGAKVPTGNTQFQFHAGDLNFHSSSYEWLVVSGANAKYKGVGAINGGGDYGFMLTATDSAINGGGTVDRFRIKIWDRANGDAVVYDNQPTEGNDSWAGTALGGGSIVIHTNKK